MLIRSDVDQNLLSKFTNTTSDSRISDQRLRSKRTGSLSISNSFYVLVPIKLKKIPSRARNVAFKYISLKLESN